MRQEPEYLPETAVQSTKDAEEMPKLTASLLSRCPYCEAAPIEMKWKGHYGCPTESCAAYVANLLPDEWNQRVQNLTLTIEDWLQDHHGIPK